MKITMAIVGSVDGKMTRGDEKNVHAWTSPEDAAFFTDMIKQCDCMVMGRKTYEAVHPKPTADVLRVVMTHRPETYKKLAIPGSLEFTAEQPQALADRLGQAGYKAMMVVGGRNVYTAFLQAGLVSDLYITVEPVLFAVGTSMLADDIPLDISLELQETRKLNNRGTLLLHYGIHRSA